MAAVAEEPTERPSAAPRRKGLRRVRGEGIRIDATRTSVYDVLLDEEARRRWLGPHSRVERADLSLYRPRVRTVAEVWPGPGQQGNGQQPHPSVVIVTIRPDGAQVALTFVLEAAPFATVVELHQQVIGDAEARRRPRSGWRAAHWRRRCLSALRHEVEAREPGRLGSRRRMKHAPDSPR